MTTKIKMSSLCAFVIMLAASLASADFRWGWTDKTPANWDTPGRWTENTAGWVQTQNLPGNTDKVVFVNDNGGPCTVVTEEVVNQLVLGQDGSGITAPLIVADGGSITTGVAWSAVGYNKGFCTLTVEAGGSVTFGQHLWVGFLKNLDETFSTGTIDIYGYVRVNEMTGLGWNGGTGFINVYDGGILDLHNFNAEGLSDPTKDVSINENSLINILSGGTIYLDGNQKSKIDAFSDVDRIIGCDGEGEVVTVWDEAMDKTIVTGIISLFDLSNITITDASRHIVPEDDPETTEDESLEFAIENMFEDGYTVNDMQTIFEADPAGAGAVYYVEFSTNQPAKVNTLRLQMNQDPEPEPARAINYFRLLAKSLGSETYDIVLYGQPIDTPYDLTDMTMDVMFPVVATDYRVEFTGNDDQGPRIQELSATGTFEEDLSTISQVWETARLSIIDSAPVKGDFPAANSFEEGEGVDSLQTIFEDNIPADSDSLLGPNIYYIDWATDNIVEVESLSFKVSHDALEEPLPGVEPADPDRAVNHVTIRAMSINSDTYDVVLYDGDVPVPNDGPFIGQAVLETPVRARNFRAEFTGHIEASGPRINELDAVGRIIPESYFDLTGDGMVNNPDFAVIAADWQLDTSATESTVIDDFESYTDLNNSNWEIELGDFYSAISLITNPAEAHGGSKALRWEYDVAAGSEYSDIAGIILTLDTPLNPADYSRMTIWINRGAENGEVSSFAVNLLSANDAVLASAVTAVDEPAGVYEQLVVDLGSIQAQAGDIAKINLHITKDTGITGGAGVIDIDDIEVSAACESPLADYNGDCIVNFDDIELMLREWLQGA
ncbi:hypothetical protein SMSP2_00783 [Limihaloglobus sulfuriphilus]|uniref:Uncharacterized protein n=1 Tax=Limihaloglobus sulfuriphilus TaxID=1851148 RepID=A0A1Q2MCL6_9BACT|nr:hypothetical protein [Limihaloglobus sulfuriphilus]AQQ70435.1 hypothetical protein SMSP2_00783 [Limihaloglobus sulfuriphilus]